MSPSSRFADSKAVDAALQEAKSVFSESKFFVPRDSVDMLDEAAHGKVNAPRDAETLQGRLAMLLVIPFNEKDDRLFSPRLLLVADHGVPRQETFQDEQSGSACL